MIALTALLALFACLPARADTDCPTGGASQQFSYFPPCFPQLHKGAGGAV